MQTLRLHQVTRLDGQTHLLRGASRAKVAPSSRTNCVLFDRCLPLALFTLVALTRNKASNDQGAVLSSAGIVQTLFQGIVTLRLGRRPFPGNSNQLCTIGNTNRESKANNSDISVALQHGQQIFVRAKSPSSTSCQAEGVRAHDSQ